LGKGGLGLPIHHYSLLPRNNSGSPSGQGNATPDHVKKELGSSKPGAEGHPQVDSNSSASPAGVLMGVARGPRGSGAGGGDVHMEVAV
jgi:hypothetical protein